MKVIPTQDGGIKIHPEDNAEVFLFDRFHEGISEYTIWDYDNTPEQYPYMVIFPKGFTFEELKKHND